MFYPGLFTLKNQIITQTLILNIYRYRGQFGCNFNVEGVNMLGNSVHCIRFKRTLDPNFPYEFF